MRATSIVTLAGSAMLLAAAAGSANAGPVSGLGKLDLLPVATNGGVEQVHWRHRHRHWRHRYWGPRVYSWYGYGGCWWRYGRRYCSW